ncbi:hypothetical protein E4U35_001840 [Claviceps purpurea]|nr:hypothetical protein E4U51_000048 [Claviceps purpurea]KAG6192234.1 hypothetical protein E4U27_003539 [Claviceps purpurea]KAG6211736.1 hypothetical protein E4U35_001840 [Claviceps purpurea]KAG6219827.1 hypothetical protein E4U26_007094 [Claviceps purpurea]KAG6273082.1 hypothetical protein E4U48_002967 [Claviceps purpurea]
MSIDLNWETLTSGPDGDALAERIRSFIHDKFQTVPLPRFIRSVNVHGFDFGSTPPELDLKDITDPLPDFYDEEIAEDESDDEYESDDEAAAHHLAAERARHAALAGSLKKRRPGGARAALRNDLFGHDLGSPFLGASTAGILGGPGLNYFQSHLGTGTHTPLAAVAGAHLGNNTWMDQSDLQNKHLNRRQNQDHHPHQHGARRHRISSSSSISVDNVSETMDEPLLREKESVSTLAPTVVNMSRPPTRDRHLTGSAAGNVAEEAEDGGGHETGDNYHDKRDEEGEDDEDGTTAPDADTVPPPRREPRVDDVQAVFRIRYAGDIRLQLAAEILLDYPMPSFVGIPLKLNITGMSFDGVGVLAKIRKRVHFCFLSPEDALAAVGSVDDGGIDVDKEQGTSDGTEKNKAGGLRFGGLLQEIKVESEIGERDGGKQSLKNVGKVERFVLEQVRRIFEEEFVYPSFWTFLV